MKTQHSIVRKYIRQTIKEVLNEANKLNEDNGEITQKKLITLFKKKKPTQVMMVYLKHSGKYSHTWVAIDHLEQLTSNKTYGHGTSEHGDAVEFKFSEVSSVKVK